MILLDEALLTNISSYLRYQLERVEIGGTFGWDPIFSNAHGVGGNHTLAIIMRPISNVVFNSDIVNQAAHSEELSKILYNGAEKAGVHITNITFSTKLELQGFIIAIDLEVKS